MSLAWTIAKGIPHAKAFNADESWHQKRFKKRRASQRAGREG